jgi:hypothetical protein
MDIALKELRGTECWVFLDDLIIFSDTIQEQAVRLEHVFQRFERANLLFQPAKCVFAKSEVKYLGYVVSGEGISASPDKLKTVQNKFVGLHNVSFFHADCCNITTSS